MVEIIKGVDIVQIRKVPTESKGTLQFFESNNDLPFEIRRIYYITNVKAGTWRGGHAHKELKQLLYCPYGKILIKLSNIDEEVEYLLDRPNVGIMIRQPTWRDMLWKIDNSVLCVAASEYYTEADYIRNFSKYEMYLKGVK